jgi:hypothetical protein
MAIENPLWGQERIADELLLKLGIRVSPRTVAKYMPRPTPGLPRGNQRWSTFLRNRAKPWTPIADMLAKIDLRREGPKPT